MFKLQMLLKENIKKTVSHKNYLKLSKINQG